MAQLFNCLCLFFFFRCLTDGQWYSFNDQHVTRVDVFTISVRFPRKIRQILTISCIEQFYVYIHVRFYGIEVLFYSRENKLILLCCILPRIFCKLTLLCCNLQRKLCCNHPKIWTRLLYCRQVCPKDADRIADSVEPNQEQSDLSQHCLPRPIQKLRIITAFYVFN